MEWWKLNPCPKVCNWSNPTWLPFSQRSPALFHNSSHSSLLPSKCWAPSWTCATWCHFSPFFQILLKTYLPHNLWLILLLLILTTAVKSHEEKATERMHRNWELYLMPENCLQQLSAGNVALKWKQNVQSLITEHRSFLVWEARRANILVIKS